MLVWKATQSKAFNARSVSVTPVYCGLELDRCYLDPMTPQWQNAATRQVWLDANEFFNAADRQGADRSSERIHGL